MARNASSPFSSGSGGPIFELRTIAWYLLKMIGSGSPFSNRPGTIEKLSVQARPQGWLLDDIVLQMNNSGVIWRALISCKSGPLAGTEVWNETMHDAWEHLLGKNGFKAQVDLMVVETGIDSDEYVRLLRHLVVGASAFQDDTYHQRICATAEDIKSVISKERKEMYWKCKCPEDLLIGQTKITEPNELLRNILFRQRDWMVNSPESLADAIEVARNLLINGDENAGLNLWNSLIGVASDLNPVGGEFSRDQLISRLLSEGYAFYADANIRNDLEKVRQWCRNRSDGLVTHSMGELTIPRDLSIAELRDEMCSTQITILYGPSGAGKSSLSVRAFDSLPNGLLLYVPIESVLDGAWDLMLNGLQSPIARISSLSNSGITWLIDGAEKAIHQGREKDLSILISTLMPDRQTENRKIIIVTQSQAAEEIIGVCRSRKIPHSSVMIDVLQDADLQLIVAKYPQLRRLLLTDSINPIFRLPKVLEVIISNIGETEDINGIFGESDVVNWYWEKIVKRAVQPIGQKAILQLSQQQAETWQSETSL